MRDEKQTELQHVTIDVQDRADVVAWAYALHVSEQQLMDAVAVVGRAARYVIPYLLRKPGAPGNQPLR